MFCNLPFFVIASFFMFVFLRHKEGKNKKCKFLSETSLLASRRVLRKDYWGQNDYMPKNCFEQLIFELHRTTVHLLSFARINFRL